MKLSAHDAIALVEVWTGIKNYIPLKDQKQAVEQYISSLDETGLADLSIAAIEMYGICDTFDSVLRTYCIENGYVEDLDDDEWEE